MEKTIKYLENGEYHYATVKDVGDLAKLKTDSKDDLVTAINDLFENGGKNAGKPEGYDKLVDQMADTIKKQQDISGKLNSAENDLKQKIADSNSSNRTITDELNAQIEAERQKVEALRLAAEQAQKELNEQVAKLNADSQELRKKTTDLANDVENKFGSVQNDYKTVSENLTNEAAALHKQLGDVKNEAEATKSRIQDQAEDIGNIHKTIDNVSNQVTQKIWMTDLDPVKQQVTQNSTEVQETQNQLKTKAEQSSLDLVANSVEKLDTEVKKNSEGLEVTVKKEEFAEDVAKLLKDKTNLLLGTRNFAGDKWSNLDHWHEEPGYWNGLKVYSSTSDWYGIQYQYEVKKGNQYTFSFYARQQSENNSAYIMLSEGSTGSQLACTEPYQKSDTHIGTEWKRYSLTFQAIADGTIYPRVEQSVTNNTIYVAGYKLELGKVATPWEPNEADVAENIEHNESQFNVYSDQIAGIVKKQEKMGDTERQLDTRITETAEGLKQTSKDLQDANGKITEFKGQLESTARGLKTEYEKYTNDAIGQISDSSLNLIHNSAFSNRNSDFDQWQNVSAKVNIREDNNQLRWAEITQSGLTSDNPVGLTSNYFNVKQGKVTVAVDIKSGEKATLDNPSVLFIELYDQNKKRVDFQWVNLNDLGLSTEILSDHLVHRGMYRKGIDRADAKYMTVKAHVMRNGDLLFTNFSARLSSIDDGGYTPNPDDVNQQILKQNTKIEQDAKQIALKANSVDVTRDIKSAVDGIQVGGRNLLLKTSTDEKSGKSYDFAQYSIAGGLQPGTTYTMSGWARVDQKAMDNKQNVFICAYTSDWSWSSWLNIAGSLTAKYNKITFTTPTGKSFSPVVTIYLSHPNNDNSKDSLSGIGFISRLKLEEGNKATSWTPSPEDTSEEIKSAKDAAIKVSSDQIDLHVNELRTSFDDKLNEQINEAKSASQKFTSDGIEQTVKKITDVKNGVDRLGDKVNNIQVGGRNLLRNSDKDISITSHTTDGWPAWANIDTGYSFEHGKTYTFSTEARNSTDKITEASIRVFEFSTNTQVGIYAFPADGKRHSVTFTVPNDSHDYHLLLYAGHAGIVPGVNVTTTYHHPKLEEGNVATDWTPAPEDVDSKFQYKEVTGVIDFNDLKTQQKIFYKDTQAKNSPAGGSYWYFVDVDVVPGTARIVQTATSDRNNITWKRTFADSWTAWQKQATQGDVDALRTETTASVKNLGDRVTTEVNSITSRVDSNNGGGINLQVGTDDCSFPIGNNGNEVNIENYSGTTKMFHAKKGGFYSQYNAKSFVPTPGETYTLSADVKGNGTISGDLFRYEGGDNGNLGTIKLTNDWQRISNTVHINKVSGQWVFYIRDSNDFYVKHIKIERGSVATPWSPAPEDTTDAIKTLNTKWDVANGQIQGKVTATDVNNILNGKGYATQSWAQTMFTMKSDAITLQAVRDNITNGIQNQVNDTRNILNNLQVGGRNYLQESDKLITGWAQDLGTLPNEVLNSLAGKTITVSVDVEWSNFKSDGSKQNRLGFEAAVTGSDGKGYWLGAWKWPSTPSGKERISAQWSLPAGVTFTANNNSANGYVSISGTGKVSHAKIEVGNKQTDWSPAPEDSKSYTDQQITNTNKKIDTQTLDSANIDQMKTQGHYFVKNLTGNPIPGWVYVDVTGNGNDRIRQDVYADQSYVHKFRSWNGSRWTDWEEEVKNTDIISKINISPEKIRLLSNKIEIDGNTYIHGELNVPNVKLNGNNGSIDLSGDGIHIGGSDGDIKLDSGGIDITKNGQGLSITGDYIQVVTDSNGQKEITGLIGSNFNLKNKNQNGLALLVTPQQELGRPYGGDLLTIGELQKNGEVTSAVTFDATNITGDGAGFHWTAPHYLHGPAQAIHITETQDNLTLLPLKMPHSSQENYYQPALTVTHGVDGNGNYVHGDSGVEFLWSSIKPYGSVDMTDARLWVYGVDHGIKNVWVSWSNWDGGERYPALVNDIGYWGGIAFPKSGRVTLFDADGRYYSPDKSTGIGAYNNYMGKNNNWH